MFLLEATESAEAIDPIELVNVVEEVSTNFHLPPIAVSIIVAVVIIICAKVITFIAKKFFTRLSRYHKKFTKIMSALVIRIISVLVWLIAIISVLGVFGIDLTPLLAGIGITGVVLGFALQESISSLFSGVMIAINNPFRVGDWVEIGQDGVAGTVVDIDLMCVTLMTADNKKYVINNKYAWSNTILNASYTQMRRLDMTVSIRYADDTEKAKTVLRDLISSYPEILPEPAALVEIGSYGESSINIYVRPWVKPSDYWNVYWRFNSDVLKALKANGLDMPFNQLVVQIAKD